MTNQGDFFEKLGMSPEPEEIISEEPRPFNPPMTSEGKTAEMPKVRKLGDDKLEEIAEKYEGSPEAYKYTAAEAAFFALKGKKHTPDDLKRLEEIIERERERIQNYQNQRKDIY